ncbi:MAG TPA: hypothetical protein VGO29_10400 [Solirubrobacteraceae bacterium]|jgi:hypothetical protein|nr:hypothetical protein [Solirubrobacteraceae bacterium]
MLRFLLEHTPVKRLARGVPVVALLSAAEVAKPPPVGTSQGCSRRSAGDCSRSSPRRDTGGAR